MELTKGALKQVMTKPYIAGSLAEMAAWRRENGAVWLSAGSKETTAPETARDLVAFVPTMGALHDGHIELVRRAKARGGKVVVSIFVNPYQFAPHEDFNKYPRTFERDLELLAQAGVDAVFYPTEAEMYPRGKDSIVSVVPPSPLNDTLEGAFRPTFFRGVATVVLKLFNAVQPHVAFFGEKDYQQLQVIKALVRDLDVPVEIVPVQTVREQDGLAMSSRNAYLDAEKRQVATTLHKALSLVKERYQAAHAAGKTIPVAEPLKEGSDMIEQAGFELQYLTVCDAETLLPQETFHAPFVVLVAAKLGEVRLIDNLVVA